MAHRRRRFLNRIANALVAVLGLAAPCALVGLTAAPRAPTWGDIKHR
jgi:hypothetical protein